MKIFKYELALVPTQAVRLPRGAHLLHCAAQSGQVKLWAMVNPDAPTVPVAMCLVGTGHDWPDGYRYVGTTEPSYGVVLHLGVDRRAHVFGASATTGASGSATIPPNK